MTYFLCKESRQRNSNLLPMNVYSPAVTGRHRGLSFLRGRAEKIPTKISRRENPCGIFFMRVLLVLFLQEKNGPLFS
ncbi:hypothetical protein SUBVAR_06625 [Subdoligranulum variabile DSM 15176]|uniref:Uncharacterized protein n=1 Tax=Subdoligranulum variabile DSM 15176 TaxID=411471 RepID=D1PQF6_9FIRM|nr:hypothetical protein SUBVAR_06625 [Subdoligranulum variabile DSM 15176]